MLTLYDAPRCPYCARTRIVLAEKGVPYETVTIDLASRPAWLLEHNPPDGRVPVLEDDGWVHVTPVAQRGRPDKKVYSVSDTGRAELRRWIAEPLTGRGSTVADSRA